MEFGLDSGHGMAYGWEGNGGIGIGNRNRLWGMRNGNGMELMGGIGILWSVCVIGSDGSEI
jgi:hypothetical protein